MSPQVAAEIAAKEQPSRADLKELGVSGWNAKERAQLSSLFGDALADQERMTTNQRAIEQLEEAASWQQRESEKAQERETAAEANRELTVERKPFRGPSRRPNHPLIQPPTICGRLTLTKKHL